MANVQALHPSPTAADVATGYLRDKGWSAMTSEERGFAVAVLGPDLNGTHYDGKARHETLVMGAPRSFVPAQ